MAACLGKSFENLGNISPLKPTAVVCSFVLLNEFKSIGFKKAGVFSPVGISIASVLRMLTIQKN